MQRPPATCTWAGVGGRGGGGTALGRQPACTGCQRRNPLGRQQACTGGPRGTAWQAASMRWCQQCAKRAGSSINRLPAGGSHGEQLGAYRPCLGAGGGVGDELPHGVAAPGGDGAPRSQGLLPALVRGVGAANRRSTQRQGRKFQGRDVSFFLLVGRVWAASGHTRSLCCKQGQGRVGSRQGGWDRCKVSAAISLGGCLQQC